MKSTQINHFLHKESNTTHRAIILRLIFNVCVVFYLDFSQRKCFLFCIFYYEYMLYIYTMPIVYRRNILVLTGIKNDKCCILPWKIHSAAKYCALLASISQYKCAEYFADKCITISLDICWYIKYKGAQIYGAIPCTMYLHNYYKHKLLIWKRAIFACGAFSMSNVSVPIQFNIFIELNWIELYLYHSCIIVYTC